MPAGLRQIQDPAKSHIFIETEGCISLFSYYRRKRQIQTQEIVANGQAFHALKEKHQPGLHSS